MGAIRVGFVGCGRIADLHALGYQDNEKARIYAICDTDPELLARRRKEWGAEKSYGDFQEMLADPGLDAVEILAPHKLHEEMVLAAVRSGKHVAVQKPMTIDLGSADRMIAAAREAGVVYKVTENYAFYPPIVRARKLIEEGAIGKPIHLHLKYIGGTEGGWEIPASSWEWRIKEMAEGRGQLTFDHGHHLWSTAWFLLGDIERVVAWIDPQEPVVDSPATIAWKYSGGKIHGVCEMSQSLELRVPSRYYANDEWMEVTGSQGILVLRRNTGLLREGPPLSLFDGKKWHHTELPSDWPEGFKGSTANFIAAIRGEEAPRLSGEEGRTILRVALAIQKSARLRREVFPEELDRRFSGLYAWARRRRERRQAAGKGGFFSFLEGGANSMHAPEAIQLTEDLVARFDPDAYPGWETSIALHLCPNDPDFEARLTLYVADGAARLEKDYLAPDAVMTVQMSAGLWASILLKKKRIETAVLQGRIKVEGKAEEALKLLKAFRIST